MATFGNILPAGQTWAINSDFVASYANECGFVRLISYLDVRCRPFIKFRTTVTIAPYFVPMHHVHLYVTENRVSVFDRGMKILIAARRKNYSVAQTSAHLVAFGNCSICLAFIGEDLPS